MFSYQLYSSRNFPPLAKTLEMVAATGYRAVEGFGGLYADQAGLTDISAGLRANDLKMPSGHFGLAQVEDTPDWAITVAKTLGMQQVIVPWIHPDERPTTGKGWHDLGVRLQKAGQPIRDAGLRFGWHNHDFEFVKTADGAMPQTALFEGGPDLAWEMDVAWVIRGGADPLAWIAEHKSRIIAAHVKDIAAKGDNLAEDGWADLGYGVVDWATILPALRAIGVTNFVMEHDNPADHARFARRSLASAQDL
ncbi:MAG: Xylose isomerase [Cypionkella sp.]|uniref:sugar phosphate isomerase/epimerase family protein n=1 Tax=Cypionkella sp. TaxID=2811411 RepID=UPI002629B79E|nr:sugar phosphate isomerase/epimerase [Cypionkella sp.]MDB5660433.1 Xylose isomerase [Cypionkella sp.]